MSIRIELTPEVEADLAAEAAKTGVPLNHYVRTVLEQHLLRAKIRPPKMSPAERARAFEDWVLKFPYRRMQPLPDEAIRRESFYSRDDE